MVKVFVSHAREDAAVAERIAAYLEQRGTACWIAPRDVPAGMEYGAAILQGIEESTVLLLVLSEQSNESQFVHREVERAVSKAKPILPMRIREIAPSGALEFFLSQAQWVDAWQPPMERHMDRLVGAIDVLSGGGAPRAAGEVTPSPQRIADRTGRASRKGLFVGLGALLAVLAVALLLWRPWQEGRPGPAAFLVGTWCQPMSGEAQAFWRFTALADERVAGELGFSHSGDIQRFEAKAAWTDAGLSLSFTAPPEWVAEEPLGLATDGDNRLTFIGAAPEEGATEPQPLTRCDV